MPFLSRLRSQLRPLLSCIAGKNRPCPNPYLQSTILLSQLPLLSPLAVLSLRPPAYTSSLPLPLWLCRPAGFFLSPARAFLKCHLLQNRQLRPSLPFLPQTIFFAYLLSSILNSFPALLRLTCRLNTSLRQFSFRLLPLPSFRAAQ